MYHLYNGHTCISRSVFYLSSPDRVCQIMDIAIIRVSWSQATYWL